MDGHLVISKIYIYIQIIIFMPTYRPSFQLVSVRETKDLIEVALGLQNRCHGLHVYALSQWVAEFTIMSTLPLVLGHGMAGGGSVELAVWLVGELLLTTNAVYRAIVLT